MERRVRKLMDLALAQAVLVLVNLTTLRLLERRLTLMRRHLINSRKRIKRLERHGNAEGEKIERP